MTYKCNNTQAITSALLLCCGWKVHNGQSWMSEMNPCHNAVLTVIPRGIDTVRAARKSSCLYVLFHAKPCVHVWRIIIIVYGFSHLHWLCTAVNIFKLLRLFRSMKCRKINSLESVQEVCTEAFLFFNDFYIKIWWSWWHQTLNRLIVLFYWVCFKIISKSSKFFGEMELYLSTHLKLQQDLYLSMNKNKQTKKNSHPVFTYFPLSFLFFLIS